MSTWTILILAVGLSADAFAVSISKGLQTSDGVTRVALLLGTAFGLAQGLMPIIGWLLGSAFADRVARFAPWIAFVLLAAVGAKMLYEAITTTDEENARPTHGGTGSGPAISPTEVLVLAVATSIDAMAVGASLAVLEVSIWFVSTVIAVVTFLLCVAAVVIGYSVGARFRRPAEIIGGLTMIGIGIHVLIN